MSAIANGLSMILAKIAGFLAWIGKLVVAVFKAGWDFFRDVPTWIFDQAMEVAVSAIGAVDVSQMQSASGWWSGLPSEIMNMLGLIGFGAAMGIIGSAIAIRLVLQLIPFTRLGS